MPQLDIYDTKAPVAEMGYVIGQRGPRDPSQRSQSIAKAIDYCL